MVVKLENKGLIMFKVIILKIVSYWYVFIEIGLIGGLVGKIEIVICCLIVFIYL